MSRVFNSGVIAVIRTNNSDDALVIARALNDTVVDAIEITMTVPNALDVIETLVNEGVERIGAGTVRTVDQVNAIAKVGGQFVVSPHTNREIIEAAIKNNLKVTPGTATPTEMMQAMAWGATLVKIFPIWAFGGLEYIKSVLEPLPDLPIVVSGGATPEEVKEYLKLGVKGVCLGGALWEQSIVSTGSVSAVRAYAVNALSRI
ncbi:MAG: bifunctional 4-hydroxy-2-oxoglutarate aldolase/2-dehydro-3-deoxy-phosphogluconate aldolase [Candidatus Planktophila sp.]|nr:bifunctional 4-hydroxy-2-oxoglutarate aldolase/2-dehydro-3-deoxy-phosphogluconate aldolase [Candidatus Planktophila sp.]